MQVQVFAVAAVSIHSGEGCALEGCLGCVDDGGSVGFGASSGTGELSTYLLSYLQRDSGVADAFGRGCGVIHKGLLGNTQL